MSDIKRPALISFDAHKVDDKKCKENGKTVRISLILPESNEDTCPEYNYKEELAAAKRKDKVKHMKPTTNGLDPFNDDDDDVRRIAQEMEAKYGVSSPRKRRKGRRDDYADIGMGYDESDSFIDNTDGYDEIIPQYVTTLHGGFYINCGALVFKTDDEASSEVSSSSSSDEEDDSVPKPTGRKRALDSSSESEGEKETEKDLEHLDKIPKIHTNGTNEEPKLKRKLFTPDKIKHIKKKRMEEKKKHTVKELLMEKREEENNHLLPLPKTLDKLDSKEEAKDCMKENKKPHPTDNITDIIELVVKGVDDDLKKIDNVEVITNNVDKVNVITSDCENSREADDRRVEYEIVKLPENLPNDIVDTIEKIKEYASRNTEGKVKFFSGPVCDTLLRLERKCKCLGKQSRMKIYEHLGPFVKCRKETLMRRAKNLVLEDDLRKIKMLVNKLKNEVDHIMPSLLDTYEKESQKIMQKKFSKESLSNEDNKQLRMPKRRFAWSEDTRKILKEVISLRKRCFILEGKHKDNLEVLIGTYLKTDIQVLWPEGWMSMTALQKVCNSVLAPDSKKSSSSSSSNKSTTISQSLDATHSKEIQKLSSNSHLSITPVTTASQKSVNTNVDSVKSRSVNTSDITINKIDKDYSPTKTNKPLPEMIKTSNSLTITPSATVSVKTCSDRMKRIDFIDKENNSKTEDVHKQHSDNNSMQLMKESSKTKENSHHSKTDGHSKPDSSHCQIIDLTDSLTPEVKKKNPQKSKPKPYDGEKVIKVKTDLMKPKEKDDINSKVCESLADLMQQASASIMSHGNHSKPSENSKQYSSYSTTPPLDYQKIKSTTEGDEIHKAMENLKALQRLSSPAKSTETLTSSPVSVIAYNKSYSPKGVLHNAPQSPAAAAPPLRSEYKADFSSGFQEVFQRQFLNDFTLMQNSVNQSAPTSSKSHYNSSEKYPHSSDSYVNDKYFANSNNNYSQQNSSKMKNLPSQQSGSYNILDDMLANFLTEYGYPKAAGHIPKQPQK